AVGAMGGGLGTATGAAGERARPMSWRITLRPSAEREAKFNLATQPRTMSKIARARRSLPRRAGRYARSYPELTPARGFQSLELRLLETMAGPQGGPAHHLRRAGYKAFAKQGVSPT